MTNQRFRLPTRLQLANPVGDGRAGGHVRHLGNLEPTPPEAIAALTPLVLLPPVEASAVLRRRSTPDWLQINLGLVARVDWRGRGQARTAERKWLVAHHAPHWAWLERDAALEFMAKEAQQGASVLVARVWVPVRTDESSSTGATAVLLLGQPRHELFKGLCWKLLAEDLAASQTRITDGDGRLGRLEELQEAPGNDTFWRRRSERLAGRYPSADGRGWVAQGAD